MDDTIIRNWNSVVKHEDVVYHLGDFAFNNPTYYLKQLYGKIYILPGSHDKNLSNVQLPIVILTPEGLKDEYGNERKIILCHYSMRSWPLSHYASWHLWGHSHNKLEPYGLSFDVGMDTNNFFPYSLDEIIEKMSKLKPIVDFRKKAK